MPTHVTHGGGQTVSPFPGEGKGKGHGTPPPFAQFPVVGVTADSTVWTADTNCFTADGRIICTPASVAEAAGAIETFDAVRIAGGAVIDADLAEAAAASDLADAVSDVVADAVEAASALDGFDAVAVFAVAVDEPAAALDEVVAAVGAQVLFGTVVEAADAVDQFDAAVVGESVSVPGGGGVGLPSRPFRPLPVYGVGYGILPPLWGEAHGVVGVVGKSSAQVLVRAAAIGAAGQAGNAAVVLKSISVVGKGVIGARGSGEGMIMKFSGTATGHQDDDEAAVIAILLAA
jgi:hypothetical protein